MARAQRRAGRKATPTTLPLALGNTKSQEVRHTFQTLGPDARPSDVIAHLRAKGISVSRSLVTNVKRSIRTQWLAEPGERTAPRAGAVKRKSRPAKASRREPPRQNSRGPKGTTTRGTRGGLKMANV